MSATVVNGKAIAEKMKETAREIMNLLAEEKIYPYLSVILVGDNQSSAVYVRQKEKACNEIGLRSRIITLPNDCTQEELEKAVVSQVDDVNVAGVLVQLPLPKHLNETEALAHIPSYKDVDGFSHVNVGRLWKDQPVKNIACTPAGIMHIFEAHQVDMCGKHVVIVGRSNTVGKPMAALCLAHNATVTMCHSKTKNLNEITKQADILIVAIGKSKFITKDMVKQGAIVIDVGINRMNDSLCGDVEFDSVKEIASPITPVPGGVGPLTVAQLMLNTSEAAWRQRHIMKTFATPEEDKSWDEYSLQEINTAIMINSETIS